MIKEAALSIAIECNLQANTYMIDRYNQLSAVANVASAFYGVSIKYILTINLKIECNYKQI